MKFFASKGIITTVLVAGLLLAGSAVQAQSTSTDQTTIEALQEQVQQLQERVEELRAQLQDRISDDDESDSATSTDDDFRSRLQMRIDRQLSQGDRGSDVERLQELLSSNSEIYPEGLVTGYFGPLTSSAVARLQGRMGLPSVGNVGPQTLSRVNQLLEDGAGNSGVIPPGLLTAPGIQRALSGDTSTSSDDTDDDDDDTEDEDDDDNKWRSRIDIDNLSIPERIKVRLRNAFGDFRFEARDDDDDDDDDDELEIEAEAEDGETEVEVEYPDGTEEEFTFDTMDRSEVISRLAEETDLTEDEIEAVIEFEIDDEDDEDDDSDDDDEDDDDDDDTSTSTDES